YKDLDDSAVIKHKPKYISRLNGKGEFTFTNLAAGKYNVYALRETDGSKTYNDKREMFAFSDSVISVTGNTPEVTLYAYVEEPEKTTTRQPVNAEKKLRYSAKVAAG